MRGREHKSKCVEHLYVIDAAAEATGIASAPSEPLRSEVPDTDPRLPIVFPTCKTLVNSMRYARSFTVSRPRSQAITRAGGSNPQAVFYQEPQSTCHRVRCQSRDDP